jgi:hypothetical protein
MDSTRSSATGDDRTVRAVEDVDAVVVNGAAEVASEEMAVDVAEDAVIEVVTVAESLSGDLAATSRRAPAHGSWVSSDLLLLCTPVGGDLYITT